jgi:hypothetical protein
MTTGMHDKVATLHDFVVALRLQRRDAAWSRPLLWGCAAGVMTVPHSSSSGSPVSTIELVGGFPGSTAYRNIDNQLTVDPGHVIV